MVDGTREIREIEDDQTRQRLFLNRVLQDIVGFCTVLLFFLNPKP